MNISPVALISIESNLFKFFVSSKKTLYMVPFPRGVADANCPEH